MITCDEPNAAHTRIMLATLAFRNRERDQAIALIEIAIKVYERYGIEHNLHEARALLDLLQGRS
jgi:hypothetical protein